MFLLKKNIPLAVIFWILTVAVMYAIFVFSSATGAESSQTSQSLLNLIVEFLGQFLSHDVFRKIAHFTEFAALGFCMTGAIHFTFEKRNFLVSFIPCLLYAISDEVHQLFVPERACRFFDMFVDSCGVTVGIGIFILIIMLINRICNKNRLAE